MEAGRAFRARLQKKAALIVTLIWRTGCAYSACAPIQRRGHQFTQRSVCADAPSGGRAASPTLTYPHFGPLGLCATVPARRGDVTGVRKTGGYAPRTSPKSLFCASQIGSRPVTWVPWP